MAAAIHESETKENKKGVIRDEDKLNILLKRTMETAKKLEKSSGNSERAKIVPLS